MPTRIDSPEYRAEYRKGWRYSHRETARLDGTYNRSEAWMDGYLDFAAGRDMWHLLRCRDHAHCGEG